MNYKVIEYVCGCRYVWIPGGQMPRHKTCPCHNRTVSKYILWCKTCGKRIEAAVRAGYRQLYCLDCCGLRQKERARAWCQRNPGYWKKRDIKLTKYEQAEVKPPETQKDEAARQIDAWFLEMRMRFMPPELKLF